jgi:hypothetical protein
MDGMSGIRAYSYESLLKIHLTTRYSYALDTLVQTVKKDLSVQTIKMEIKPLAKKSLQFNNLLEYLVQYTRRFIRVLILYEPVKTFMLGSLVFLIPGFALVLRFFYFFVSGIGRSGHIQSLVIGAMLVILGSIIFSLSIIAMLVDFNRKQNEHLLYTQKRDYYQRHK